MYRLGKRYILETRNSQDEAAVIIRNVNSGNFIEIPAVRWATFLMLQADIDEALGKLLLKKTVNYNEHIGGGYYVSVSTSSGCVDLRRFYKDDKGEIKPTSHGLSLDSSEWCHLANQLLIIMSHEPNLRTVCLCSMREDHINNPSIILSCSECSPFDYKFGLQDEYHCNYVPRFESLSMN